MSETNDDPVIGYLRARRAELEQARADAVARIEEIGLLLKQLGDGRTRVQRKLKGEVVVLPGNGAADTMPPGDPPAAA